MPTIEEVTNVLSRMDSETYSAAVQFIFYLDSEKGRRELLDRSSQDKFIQETSGKILVDEEAVTELRMGCMI